jgi:hypothetical protein
MTYAADIHAGRHCPHARHWQALADLVSFRMCKSERAGGLKKTWRELVVGTPLKWPKTSAAKIATMGGVKKISQKSIIEVKQVFGAPINRILNYSDLLYAKNFPDWFVIHATQQYSWDWTAMLIELRRGTFFFVQDITGWQQTIVTDHAGLSPEDAKLWGEAYIQKLAAFATTLAGSEGLRRSLQLDGFEVDKDRLKLVPLEGPVSAQQEEDNLTHLVKATGLPNVPTIRKHIEDAHCTQEASTIRH